MRDRSFTTEIKHVFNPMHDVVLRTLYMPIVGPISTTLYSLLKDFHLLNKNSRTYDPISTLLDILQVSISELELAFKKLEAVGLIRSFLRTDETKYIFVVNEPLLPEAFRKNSFLYKQAVAKIGEIAFEKVEFATKETGLSKDDFAEVTTKYQDLFSFSADPAEKKETTTQEIPLVKFDSVEQAIKGLNAFQFIKFLANESLSPVQQEMIQRIQQMGFANPSINLITNYVFNVNGKIVSAHIEKIAKDFATKSIKGFDEIQKELENAYKSKNSVVFDVESTKVSSSVKSDKEDDKLPSWDEIFSSLGGEL